MRWTTTMMIALLFALRAFGGEHHFIWKDGRLEIGTLTVTSEVSGTDRQIVYESDMKVNVGMDVELTDRWEVDYRGDTLLEVHARSAVNGKNRFYVTEISGEEGWSRSVNGRERSADRDAEIFSYVRLFLEPPAGREQVYAELEGEFFSVVQKSDHEFSLTDNKGRISRFIYDADGQLSEARIHNSAGVWTLERP